MGGIQQGGGFYEKMQQNYNNKLYSGMSRSEWAAMNRQGLAERLAQSKVQTSSENIAKIQNAANMYGLQLDSGSIFSMANTDGNDVLSNKEANAFMSKLPQLAQMSSANGSSGSSSGGSNAMGLLNGLTDIAGGLLGTNNNSGGGESSDSGGGFLKKAGDFLGGLFG